MTTVESSAVLGVRFSPESQYQKKKNYGSSQCWGGQSYGHWNLHPPTLIPLSTPPIIMHTHCSDQSDTQPLPTVHFSTCLYDTDFFLFFFEWSVFFPFFACLCECTIALTRACLLGHIDNKVHSGLERGYFQKAKWVTECHKLQGWPVPFILFTQLLLAMRNLALRNLSSQIVHSGTFKIFNTRDE